MEAGVNGQEPEVGPEPSLRGRYAVYGMPGGDWLIARTAGLCETCQGCGCGEQEEPIPVPAMVVQLMQARAEGKQPPLAMLRQMGKMALGGLGG